MSLRSLVELRYWRRRLMAVQWSTPGLDEYWLSLVMAKAMSGRVPSMAYIMEPMCDWYLCTLTSGSRLVCRLSFRLDDMGVETWWEPENPKQLMTSIMYCDWEMDNKCQGRSQVISKPKNQWILPRSFILKVDISCFFFFRREGRLLERIIRSLM